MLFHFLGEFLVLIVVAAESRIWNVIWPFFPDVSGFFLSEVENVLSTCLGIFPWMLIYTCNPRLYSILEILYTLSG